MTIRVLVATIVVALGIAHAQDAPPPAIVPVPEVTPPPAEPAPLPAEPAKPAAEDTGVRTFAGSIQLDYLAVPTERSARALTFDGATAEISLRITKDFSKHASATMKLCFACHGFEAAMGFVELRAADELRVRVGRMTPSFGAFPARHDPANHLTSDKPLPYDMGRMLARDIWNEGILPAPWVDNGIEVAGTRFWDGGRFDYAAFLTSGPKGGPDAVDFDFTLSRAPEQYYVDNNSEPSLGGRAALTLEVGDYEIAAGASAMAGRYDPARELSFLIAGVDASVKKGRFALRGEYLIRRTEMALGEDPATRFKYGPENGRFDDYFTKDGFYLEGEVPLGRVTAIARWDGLRRLGNVLATSPLSSSTQVLRYTAGLAVQLQTSIQIKSSVELYQLGDLADEVALHLGVATSF
jgi:hypothetical protein